MIKQRNIFIDIAKAFAIIMVVFGHCIQYGSGQAFIEQELFFDNILFKSIYSFHMPFFMLISGYLFAYGINKEAKGIIIHKFRSLIIPVFTWAIISLIIFAVQKIQQNDFSILSAIKYYIIHSINSLWFLWAVFYNTLIVVAINRLFKDSIIVYASIFIISFILLDSYNLYLYKWMFPFFVMGYFYNKYNLKVKLYKLYCNDWFIFITGALFVLLIYFYEKEYYIYVSKYTIIGKQITTQIYIDLYRYIVGLTGSVFAFSILFKIYNLVARNNTKDNFILTIGKSTMGIYIITDLINNYILGKVTEFMSRPNYLIITMETIILIIVSIIIKKLIQKNGTLNRYLLGAK